MFIAPESTVVLSCFALSEILNISLKAKENPGRERVWLSNISALRGVWLCYPSVVRDSGKKHF